MKKIISTFLISGIALLASARNPQATTANGVVEGTVADGVEIFKGIPFAAAPVGDLRWKAPQPVQNWDGVRSAKEFGANPMQLPVFGDMNFGSPEISEDCLYLNVWTPEHKSDAKLPVLIYFNGGGLVAGSGSEPRYAGESLAKKGIIVVTPNYREGIFGFYAHPELSAETEYQGSGNYGFMDQLAAIKWVRDNIAAFGGDPDKITIAGESAGSISVATLMASPAAKGLFAQAIGSSGSSLTYDGYASLKQAEDMGLEKAAAWGANSLEELRAIPAQELLQKSQGGGMIPINIDGYVLAEQPLAVFEAGAQADVPLLVGGNSEEMSAMMLTMGQPATIDNVKKMLTPRFGDNTDKVLEAYGLLTDADLAGEGAVALASDMFLGQSTWKWTDAAAATGSKPVYRYLYTHPRPGMKITGKVAGLAGGVIDDDGSAPKMPLPKGAVHSADIEYAMNTLSTNEVYDWQPEDYKMAEIFSDIYVNFVKNGDPNGSGLVMWPPVNGQDVPPVLILDIEPKVETDKALQDRYRFMESILKK